MSMTGIAIRYFNALATMSLLVIGGVVGLSYYWLALDTEPPIAGITGKFIGYADPAERRTAIVEWTGTRNRSCPGITQRWLVDGHVVALPPHPLPYAPPGDRGTPVTWRIWIDIPKHLDDHPVRYQIEQAYACNPLQRALWPLMVYPPQVPLWHAEPASVDAPTAEFMRKARVAPTKPGN